MDCSRPAIKRRCGKCLPASPVEARQWRISQLGIALALKMIPADVMTECHARSQAVMAEGKPVNWVAAGIIIAIWLMAAAALVISMVRMLEKY